MITYALNDPHTIELNMAGEVTSEDYHAIKPGLLKLFKEHGRLNFLIKVKALKHMTFGAIMEDIKFDMKNIKFIGATAIVGDKTTQALLTPFINLVFPREVKFFEVTKEDEALQWLHHEAKDGQSQPYRA